MTQVELPEDPNYHFMADMADKSIAWMKHQKAMTPDKPFFVYFAPGAVHAPHHAPADWIAKWKGKFDQGWDKIREETLERQITMGIVPKGTKLAPKPEAIKDWGNLSASEKALFTRQVETFAAFLDYTDHHIGRVIDIAPIILEAAGLPEPKVVNGTPQIPIEGKSLLASFSDAKAPARTTQYFEIAGNRAVYHDGWLAGVVHKAPWESKPSRALEADLWELYDVRNDFSCSTDLASKHPEKLKELQAVFLAEAKKFGSSAESVWILSRERTVNVA